MHLEYGGACMKRTIDRSTTVVPAHAHDRPLLSLFVMGSYLSRTELGERFVSGLSAVLYAAGAAHENVIEADGFEQIEIEFDPAWLDLPVPTAPVARWLGGPVGAMAAALARACSADTTEERLRSAVRAFLSDAMRAPPVRQPAWLDDVTRHLKEDAGVTAPELARRARLHPSWLGAAYRRATGEGLRETAARFRLERAARLLRETDLPHAAIALEAGFFDQSHMIRTFRKTLGRLPSAVRADRAHVRSRVT